VCEKFYLIILYTEERFGITVKIFKLKGVVYIILFIIYLKEICKPKL